MAVILLSVQQLSGSASRRDKLGRPGEIFASPKFKNVDCPIIQAFYNQAQRWELVQRLGPEGYTADVTQRVYATMTERAATVVRAGYAAIADAVFARPADRDVIEQAAAAAGVPFVGIWLDAPHDVLVARAATAAG